MVNKGTNNLENLLFDDISISNLDWDPDLVLLPEDFLENLQPGAAAAAAPPLAANTAPPHPAASSVATSSSGARPSAVANPPIKKEPVRRTSSSKSIPESTSSSSTTPRVKKDALLTPEEREARRKEQVAKAVKKYRKRKRDEMLYLRDKVKELEDKINEATSSSTEPAVAKKPKESSFWEAQTQTEKKRRQEIESANHTLRVQQMENQMYFARAMEKVMQQSGPLDCFPQLQSFATMNNLMPSASSQQLPSVRINLNSNFVERKERILKSCAVDIKQAPMRLSAAGLTMSNLGKFPHVRTNARMIDGTMQLEIARATFFPGVSCQEVANMVSKIFWVQIELPKMPSVGTGGISNEELDVIDSNTSYSRFRCKMGTKSCVLPCMEKLVIRHKDFESNFECPTIIWRTVLHDELHLSGKTPRIDESGCLTVENGSVKGVSGAVLKMVVHIRPPLNTLALPPGAVIESYMAGFVDYIDQIDSLLSFLLTTAGIV